MRELGRMGLSCPYSFRGVVRRMEGPPAFPGETEGKICSIPLGDISEQSQQDTPVGNEGEESHDNTKKLQYVSARCYVYISTAWQYSEH